MENIDVVFVVLTYRNSEDLAMFFETTKKIEDSYRVVVVNAYCDEESSYAIKEVALKNDGIFIEVENNGYSYGNNKGIKYAREHFMFKFLVVANPDTEIQKWSMEQLEGDAVFGPKIENLRGKNQNPMYFCKSETALKLIYKGLKETRKFYFNIGRIINKSIRMFGCHFSKRFNNKLIPVFQLHGSFLIFSYAVIENLETVFDENMFLFAEESYLAHILEMRKIPSYYCTDIKVLHKEDGSMKYRCDISEQMKQSNIYVYEKYYNFN